MTCAGVGIADVSMSERRDEMRRVLVERRRALLTEIQSSVRDVREVGSNGNRHTTDPDEMVEAEPEDDLVFALIQMKAEILEGVNEAVRRFDEGMYGYCVDCGEVIAASRLRAMPFAVRCRHCEETFEHERRRDCINLQRVPSALGSRY